MIIHDACSFYYYLTRDLSCIENGWRLVSLGGGGFCYSVGNHYWCQEYGTAVGISWHLVLACYFLLFLFYILLRFLLYGEAFC